jgi:transcriptional regulator with XRE-family HTH domain
MQEAPHPNKLRMLLAVAGLNQREAARESNIAEGTLRHYVAGEQVIPRRDRVKLAQVIGCDIHDLAPHYDAKVDIPKRLELGHRMANDKKPLPALESNGFFSSGKLETTLIVLDGNGTETYSPQNIHTFYDFRPIQFLNEIEQMREKIAKEQAQNEMSGKLLLTLEDVCEFVFSHGPWGGGALMGIYHTLVHEFGREQVNSVISSY